MISDQNSQTLWKLGTYGLEWVAMISCAQVLYIPESCCPDTNHAPEGDENGYDICCNELYIQVLEIPRSI